MKVSLPLHSLDRESRRLRTKQILKGSLKETLFSWPEKGQAPSAPLQITKETVYGENQVTYMSDKVSYSLSPWERKGTVKSDDSYFIFHQLGLHRISNMDPNNVAISLHREFASILLSMFS